ncbi:hypothetical protein HYW53_01265 [Candidatus Giovannonibacteria bacterium]|nr:hypothetical protein [Candidatus Giovannonibacteria bacterium]
MADGRKNIIILIFAVVVLALGFIIFVWRAALENSAEKKSMDSAQNVRKSLSLAENWPLSKTLVVPTPKMDGNPLSKSDENQARIEKLRENLLPAQDFYAFSIPASKTDAKTVDMERELRKKYFSTLYPSQYMDFLKANQDFLISEGTLKPEEKVQFASEDEIFIFLKKLDVYLVSIGLIRAQSEPEFKEDIEKLIEYQNFEVKIMESKQSLRNIFKTAFNKIFGIEETSAASLLGTLTGGIGVELGIDTCWQDPTYNVMTGAQSITPCCECGLQRFGKIVVPITACTKMSGGKCNVRNFGCLNGPGYKANAIWDSVTRLCGFDSSLVSVIN